MRRTFMGAAAAGALLVTVSACDNTSGPASTGTLSVMLTDAPFAFDQVARADLFVVRIDAKMPESTAADAEDIDDDGDGEADVPLNEAGEPNDDPRRDWVTVATPNQSYNLLDLQNGNLTSLGQATLPTGPYRSFRLVLDTRQSSITLKDGTVLSGSSVPGIVWPSAGQSGIKVQLAGPLSLDADGTAMVLDFDLGRSFVLRGNTLSEGLLFKPVIRAVATASAAPTVGAVAGTLACGSADGSATPVVSGSVELLKSGTDIAETSPDSVVATTATDASGAFKFDLVTPGDYALRATRPAGTATCATATLIPSVAVTAGSTASVDVLLPAN